jgi:D-glycero-D-manno-heptose 1,7-bisphosphate phosphatase
MSGRQALFLDRDGIINEDRGYVYRVDDFAFMPGIFDLCRRAQSLGLALVVVTNQAGIGRGYYTEEDFHVLSQWMGDRFADQGINIDAVEFCLSIPRMA